VIIRLLRLVQGLLACRFAGIYHVVVLGLTFFVYF